jgi:hypothetical protein
MLLLTNDHVVQVLTMEKCVEAVEERRVDWAGASLR